MTINPDIISTLPAEISLYVLSFLDVKSLCRTSQVSKTWNQFASDDQLWKGLCSPSDLDPQLSIKAAAKQLLQPFANKVLEKVDEFAKDVEIFQKGEIKFTFSGHSNCYIKAEMQVYGDEDFVEKEAYNEEVTSINSSSNFGRYPNASYQFCNLWRITIVSEVKTFNSYEENTKLNLKIIEVLKKRAEELRSKHTESSCLSIMGRIFWVALLTPLYILLLFISPFINLVKLIIECFRPEVGVDL